jgi:hypothetical protein
MTRITLGYLFWSLVAVVLTFVATGIGIEIMRTP